MPNLARARGLFVWALGNGPRTIGLGPSMGRHAARPIQSGTCVLCAPATTLLPPPSDVVPVVRDRPYLWPKSQKTWSCGPFATAATASLP